MCICERGGPFAVRSEMFLEKVFFCSRGGGEGVSIVVVILDDNY